MACKSSLSSAQNVRSDGIRFLVARLQMESIVRKCSSVNSLFKHLDSLPSSVHDIYRHTLDRINAQPEEDAAIAYRIFLWLLHARPFQWKPRWRLHQYPTAEDIQYAVTMGPECAVFDEDNVIPLPLLLSMCGGLVIVEEVNRSNSDLTTGFKRLRFIRKHHNLQWQPSFNTALLQHDRCHSAGILGHHRISGPP